MFPVLADNFHGQNLALTEIAQQGRRSIQGVVKDVKGDLVIGASVVEAGTTNGTATDLDGRLPQLIAPNWTRSPSWAPCIPITSGRYRP